jgi:PAS domain S-box-containing protein
MDRVLIWFYMVVFPLEIFSHNFKITHYTPSKGLPHQYVYDFVKDSTGIIYIATNEGVFEYDGYEFQKLEANNNVSGNKLFARDEDGAVYGISGLLSFPIKKLINGQFVDYLTIDSNLYVNENYYESHPNYFYVFDRGSKIYISTTSALYIYTNSRWIKIKLFEHIGSDQIYNLVWYNGKAIASTSLGLYEIDDGKIIYSKINSSLPDTEILSCFNDSTSNKLWVLGNKWFGYYIDDKFFVQETYNGLIKYSPLYDERITFKKYNSHLFISSRLSSYYYNTESSEFRKLDQSFGVLSEGTHSIKYDDENIIWISSPRGLDKLVEIDIQNYSQANGLVETEISSVLKFGDDILLGHNQGFSLFNKGKFEYISISPDGVNPKKYSRILDMQRASNGKVYFASSAMGAAELNNDLSINWLDTKSNKSYISVFEMENRQIIFGSDRGIYGVDENKKLIRIAEEDIYARKFFRISRDTLGICSSKGLYLLINNSTLSHYVPEESSKNIYCGIKTIKGEILLGTSQGIVVFIDGEFTRKKLHSAFENAGVYFIHEKDQQLFVGTNMGLYISSGDDWTNFNSQNGLSGDETNRDAFFIDNENQIWVGTNNGLSIGNLNTLLTQHSHPKVIIKSIEDIHGNQYQSDVGINLTHNNNFIIIHYRALSFSDEASNRFKVHVTNIDDNITNEIITSEHSIQLVNQQPGTYRVSVAAKNFRTNWSDFVNSGLITIQKPYYLQWWFFVFNGLIVIFIFILVNSYMLKTKYASNLKKEVDSKTKELSDYSNRFSLVSKNITDVIWTVDKQLNITFVSQSFNKMFGIPNIELENDNDFINDLMSKINISEKDLCKKETIRKEINHSWKNEDSLWTEIKIDPILDEKNEFNGFVATARDITTRKNLDRIKAEAITKTSEIERARISRELHDHIGQILASIKLRLGIFSKNKFDENISIANEQILLLSDEVHNIISDMNPLHKSNKTFTQHLEEMYNRIENSFKLKITYKHDNIALKISSDKALILFRIIQESLSNIVKHAKATCVKVKIISTKKHILISVTDNGCGMNKSTINQSPNSFGIISMQQRCKILNGDFQLLSKHNWGTTIQIKIVKDELFNS